jgi:hypothetical protein
MSESDDDPSSNIEGKDVTKRFIPLHNRYKTVTKPLHSRYITTVPLLDESGTMAIRPTFGSTYLLRIRPTLII